MRYLFLIAIISFWSCKKDKIEGDKEIFIGKWKWVYTENEWRPNCDNPAIISYYTPDTELKNYTIEFLKKGCMILYENDDKIKKYRVVFDSFQPSTYILHENYYVFGIWLNNKSELAIDGFVNNDTLIIYGFFPKESSNQGCNTNINYFVKE